MSWSSFFALARNLKPGDRVRVFLEDDAGKTHEFPGTFRSVDRMARRFEVDCGGETMRLAVDQVRKASRPKSVVDRAVLAGLI